jgi:pyruvate-formate lyase-activating enzyme/TusA-related sulfurtransferase
VRRLEATVELAATDKSIAMGLLLDLVQALRSVPPGDLVALTTRDPAAAGAIERWSRLTGNGVVGRTEESDATRWVIRRGEVTGEGTSHRIGSRLWLYTNFDCNLACVYCCVRSSPRASRRELGLQCIQRIADEARQIGVEDIFLTGGEPFLLPDIGAIVATCADSAPTTVLTNAMLFRGARLEALKGMPRDRVTLQISIDSPDPELHDRQRGAGSWQRAMDGIECARSLGFRVRWAATVLGEDAADAFSRFLDRGAVIPEDRVIRRTALRGFAETGIALSRADLVPEVTITDRGVYYHPVGATDDDLLISRDIFPLADAIDAVRQVFAAERAHRTSLAGIFNCA